MKKTLLGLLVVWSLLLPTQSRSADYEVGLSMYSLRKLFKSGQLTAMDYPAFAKEKFGITKIDVWTGGFPEGWEDDADFLPNLKKAADESGSEIFLVMAQIVDCRPDEEKKLRAKGSMHKWAVDAAETLDSKFVRIFVRADPNADEDIATKKIITALEPLADYAKSKDKILVIEPMPIKHSRSGAFLANLVKTFGHDHCWLMPDFGKMKGTDIYQGTEDMMPYAKAISAKTHNINEDGSAEGFDYPRLMKIINDTGYNGIIAIEYEGKNLGPVEGVLATKKLIEQS
ncbi:MAG: TIM barrel protein [Verrucomicrobiota bacterium]